MSDALVYAWSKDIDPLFPCDKMLFPDSPADLYAARRMSDSALSAETGTTATTDPDSPATEPDAAPAPTDARKPSLPGIGALTPLLDPAPSDAFPRRASLPTLTSDLSLSRSPSTSLSRASFRPRPYDAQLSGYSFPPVAEHERPRIDSSFSTQYFPQNNTAATSATATSFNSPFTSPLSPEYHSSRSASLPRDEAFNPFAQPTRWPAADQQQWSPSTPDVPPTPASASASNSPRPKRRASASPPAPAPQSPAQTPQTQESQPQRRRGKLPKHTTDLLKEWLHAHSDHPYPSEDEKRDLCARTKLSMSQVSNWMINARRRILAPAKHPTQAATTTEPYRPLPRPIGSLYPTHHHHPQHLYPPPQSIVRRVSSEADSLRLYDPAYHQSQAYAHANAQYSPQGMYDPARGPERRLAYPASTVGYPESYAAPQQGQGYAPPPQLFLPNQRDTTPRYFAAGEPGAL